MALILQPMLAIVAARIGMALPSAYQRLPIHSSKARVMPARRVIYSPGGVPLLFYEPGLKSRQSSAPAFSQSYFIGLGGEKKPAGKIIFTLYCNKMDDISIALPEDIIRR